MAVPATSRKTVLLVEDDPEVRASIAELLHEAGYSVETAADGDDAWAKLMNNRPGVLVLDLKLPGLSGWDLLDRLKTSTTLIALPVIVLSAHLGSMPSGALAWLKKPLDPSQLVATVDRLLRN